MSITQYFKDGRWLAPHLGWFEAKGLELHWDNGDVTANLWPDTCFQVAAFPEDKITVCS